MAYSKIILNGETLMDVTGDTVDAGNLLSGKTATKNSGAKVTGNIASKSSSDLTVSGATVTAPAGYYSSSASKSVATGTATAPTSISGTSATVSTGTNTLTLSKTVSNTPRITTAGYISSGTAGNSSVSLTANVTTKAAATITPSTSAQTIASGTYLTGTQTISAMPSGTAGTPTATKGTVSNHAVSVTPSVTNTTGYITGGTKTGTAVSVSASELVSGTKSITENGSSIDVTDYASVDVDVPSTPDPYPFYNDGKDRYYISIDSLHYRTFGINVYQSKSNLTSVDWGDGSPIETFPSSTTLYHTYASVGVYCIVVAKTTTGTARVRGFSSSTSYVGSGGIDVGDTHAFSRLLAAEISLGCSNYMLRHCQSLKKLSFNITPNGITGLLSNCSSIQDTNFFQTNFTINGSTEIFRECNSLRTADLSKITVTNETYNNLEMAFLECYNLVSVKLPNGIVEIGRQAFQKCSQLEEIEIPTTITRLRTQAFYQCTSLKTITIPSTVTNIENSCFNGCSELEEIHVLPTTPPTLGSYVFNGTSSNLKIYVPASSLSTYQTATNWSTYASYMVGE